MGMADVFRQRDEYVANVYTNDCDEDVCTAWYLLNRLGSITRPTDPRLDQFIAVAGVLDVTAGAYPYDPKLPILGELAWMFEPYRQFRASKEMALKDNGQYASVIREVEGRIAQHLAGAGKSTPLDTRYKIVGGNEEWKMIEETGAEGRVGAFYDGIDAYVIVQEEITGERWRYTIGKRSDFVPFDVAGVLEQLNLAEQCGEDRWGGGSTIGGSPRVAGSRLAPGKVEEILRNYTARSKTAHIT
jgi:hypothetical protein